MEEWGMTDVERYLYERDIDSVRIENAIIRGTKRHAMEKGMKKGMEKGMEKGLEQGRKEAKRETAQKMLAAGFDKKTILEITGVDVNLLSVDL